MRISIIIPFYNVEKYIAECLDSVYAQDIPESEYEVICVNDCSPDNSRAIVLEYQKKHENLILIEHETNKMLGAGRNTGLRAARGEYVWFIDSDDYIEKNVFGHLLSIVERDDLEILHFNCFQYTTTSNKDRFQYFPFDTGIITGVDYINSNLNHYWERIVTAWSKICKREFLISNTLFYPEGVFFEDNVHTLKVLLLCSRFRYIPNQLYYYRVNETSIMSSNIYGGKKMGDKALFHIDCLALIHSFQTENSAVRLEEAVFSYCYYLIHSKKAFFYLSFNEKKAFYTRIKNTDLSVLEHYLRFIDRFIYTHSSLTLVISFFPMLILIPSRKIIRLLKK